AGFSSSGSPSSGVWADRWSDGRTGATHGRGDPRRGLGRRIPAAARASAGQGRGGEPGITALFAVGDRRGRRSARSLGPAGPGGTGGAGLGSGGAGGEARRDPRGRALGDGDLTGGAEPPGLDRGDRSAGDRIPRARRLARAAGATAAAV